MDMVYPQDPSFLTVPMSNSISSTMQNFGFSISMGSLLAWQDLYDFYGDQEDDDGEGGLLCKDKLPHWYGQMPNPDWYKGLPVSTQQQQQQQHIFSFNCIPFYTLQHKFFEHDI